MSSIANMLKEDVANNRCRFSKLMDVVDADDAEAIDSAMKANLTPNRIAKAIRTGGHKISHSTIQEHKDKTCICEGKYKWEL